MKRPVIPKVGRFTASPNLKLNPIKNTVKLKTSSSISTPKREIDENTMSGEIADLKLDEDLSRDDDLNEIDLDNLSDQTISDQTISKWPVDDLHKYKIMVLSSSEMKERDLVANPIINKYKELMQDELRKALNNSNAFMEAKKKKEEAINDFLRKCYSELPEDVFVSRLFLEEGYAECQINLKEADKVRKLLGV